MHLALDDLIRNLKDVSGEKELALEKKEKLRHSLDREKQSLQHTITSEELKVFQEVLGDLKENLNVHSYQAFIAPLRLVHVEGERVVISAPTDSLSWVIDHYLDRIRDTYREHTGRDIAVEII